MADKLLKSQLNQLVQEQVKTVVQEFRFKLKEMFGLDQYGRGDEQLLQKYIKQAEEKSRAGHVVHVNKTDVGFELSDWFDSDQTVASFENGRKLEETAQDPHPPLKEGVLNKLSQLEVGDQFLVQDDLYIKRSGPYPGTLFKKGRLDKIPFTVLKKNPTTLVLGFDKKYVVDTLTKAKGLYDQTTNVIPSNLAAKFQPKVWVCVVDFTPKTIKTKKGPTTVGVDSKVRVTKR